MATFCVAASEGILDEVAVYRYLKDWWLPHVVESDRQYRDFAESKL
jgi:hypothetical protein